MAGRYEKFKIGGWSVGSNECIEFTLNKPYNSTNWLAALMFLVEGDSKKEISKIMLYTEHKDSNSLTLAYVGSNKEYRVIQQNINFGEVIKFNVKITKNEMLEIKLPHSEFSIPLHFNASSVLVGATSSKATAKIFEKLDCKIQK